MRLQKIGTYYASLLKQFYARHPALAAQPYPAQHAALMHECFGSSDFWTFALNRLGYITDEVVANAEPMQRRWASENELTYDENNWVLEIAAAQVKAFRPDVLIVADYVTFTAEFLRRLRSQCASIRLVLGGCGSPYSDPSVFHQYDIVISPIPELVQHFKQNGHRSYHVNHAFEPRVLERIDVKASPTADFAFLGSVVKSSQFHIEREKILLDLIEQSDLQIWSDVQRASSRQRRNVRARQWAYDGLRAVERVGVPQSLLTAAPLIRKVSRWQSRPALSQSVDDRIARRARPPLFGLAMFQQLHDSKVALNTHIDISPINASNMRLFEATGVGTCLLTDWKPNLRELFEPDVEVLTYRDAAECVEKVRYILAHESQRRAVAAAGQRRALRDHNFDSRAARIDEIIRGALTK